MSRKSRTTLTFTVTIPLPQKGAAKGAAEFIRHALHHEQERIHGNGEPNPLAFLAVNEIVIRQTGRETVYY